MWEAREADGASPNERATEGRVMAERAIGSALGQYLIRGMIGRGGMATVYRALHVPLSREVALKVIAAEVRADEEFRTRFQAEQRLAAAVVHPHIVPVYDAGEVEG